MRILVVEDERKIATFIQKGLRECGFVVDIVHRGDAALEIIEENHFDAVVLDIMLPGRDGLSVLRVLRERSSAVPVIILTERLRRKIDDGEPTKLIQTVRGIGYKIEETK